MKIFLLLSFLALSGCALSQTYSDNLIGMTDRQILWRFDKPMITRTEDPYQLWSYRQNSCSMLLYFDKEKIVRFVDFSGDC